MATDPLADLFGSPADPLADIFGKAEKPASTSLTKPFSGDFGYQPGKIGGLLGMEEEEAEPRPREILSVRKAPAPKAVIETEDSWGQIGAKWFQNLDDRAKVWAGGLMQALPEAAAQSAGGVASVFGGQRLGDAVTELVRGPLDEAGRPVVETGAGISGTGRAGMEANAPDFGPGGQDTAKRYAYDIANAFVDFGAAIGTAVVTRSPTAGAAVAGGQAFGHQYDASIQNGRTTDQAFQDASFYGVAELIPEKIAIEALMKPGGKFLGKVLKGAAAEGIQEAVTEVLQLGYDAGVLKEDMTFGEAVRRVVDAGIIGAVAGGGIGGVVAGAEKLSAKPDDGELLLTDVFSGPEAADVPLTPDDIASPIPDPIIQEGKNLAAEALKEFEAPEGVTIEIDRADLTPAATEPASADSIEAVKARIRGAESGGNDQAKNPNSTATGRYQFTKGTWEGLGGDWSKRTDPAEQERLMDKLTSQNAAALKKAGNATTAGNIYLAHFLGSAGAIKALADPNAPVDAKVQAANPFTEGWTNGRLAAWATRKMGGKLGEWTNNPNLGAERSYRDRDGTDGELTPVESTLESVKRRTGEDLLDFTVGQRVVVEQNGEAVEGTVRETYGEGEERGVVIDRDDGTTFDETLAAAKEFGARITAPGESVSQKDTVAATDNNRPPIEPEGGPAEVIDMPGLKERNKLRLIVAKRGDGYEAEVDYELGGFSGGTAGVGRGSTREEAIADSYRAAERNLDPDKFGSSANDQHRTAATKMRAWLQSQAPTSDSQIATDAPAEKPAKFVADQHVPALKELVSKSKISLSDTKKIAARLGVSENEARKVMGALASRPGSGFFMTKGRPAKRNKSGRIIRKAVPPRMQRIAQRTKPMSVMEFVRAAGGVQSGRHDLRNVGAISRYPGVLNKKGRQVDEIGEALWEAGYFTGRDPSDLKSRPTESETIEFLERASLKLTTAIDDLDPTTHSFTDDEQLEQMRRAVESEIADEGFDFNEDEIADAVRYLDSGLSVGAAVVSAMDDAAARVLEIGFEETGNEFYESVRDEIYEGDQAEERGGAEEALAGPESDEGDAEGSRAPDAQPAESGEPAEDLTEPEPTASLPAKVANIKTALSDTHRQVIVTGANKAQVAEIDRRIGKKGAPKSDGSVVYPVKDSERLNNIAAAINERFPATSNATAPEPGATPEEAAANVYTYMAGKGSDQLAEGIRPHQWLGDMRLQAGNPHRFHRVTQVDNPKGLKVGDRVKVKGKDAEAYVVSTAGKVGNRDYDIKVQSADSYGGWYDLADVELFGAPRPQTDLLEAEYADIEQRRLRGLRPTDRQLLMGLQRVRDQNGFRDLENPLQGYVGSLYELEQRGLPITEANVGKIADDYADEFFDRRPGKKGGGMMHSFFENLYAHHLGQSIPFPNGGVPKSLRDEGAATDLLGQPIEGAKPVAPTPEPAQDDMFGTRPGDQRTALERQGEGRMRSGRAQKAAGEDGGLFDVQDTTGDILAPESGTPPLLRAFVDEAAGTPEGAAAKAFVEGLGTGGEWPQWQAAFIIGARGEKQEFAPNEALEQRAYRAGKKWAAEQAPAKPASYGASNKVFTADAAEKARQLIRSKLGQINAGFDPELAMAGMQLAGFHVEAGARKFAAFVKAIADDLGISMGELKPYLAAWYNGARDMLEGQGEDISDMDGAGAVRAAVGMIETSVTAPVGGIVEPKGTENVSSATGGLEPDRAGAPAGVGAGEAALPDANGVDAGEAGTGGGRAGEAGGGLVGVGGLFDALPPAVGAGSGRGVRDQSSAVPGRTTDLREPERGGDRSLTRPPDERVGADATAATADQSQDLAAKEAAQRAADSIRVVPRDLANIRETLPYLTEPQQEDVLKAEQRFAVGEGMLFTNGTGTGKTFTGGGTVARFVRQGKGNILILAPSQGIISDWTKALAKLGIEANPLQSTTDQGEGVSLTTYANFASNPSLAKRDFDLVVADESHTLMSAKAADATKNIEAFRAVTNHPRGRAERARRRLADRWAKFDAIRASYLARPSREQRGHWTQLLSEGEKVALEKLGRETDALEKSFAAAPRSKVMFLSATPFAYVKNIEYAEGYLFEYGPDQAEGRMRGYNEPDPREAFFIQHFGYRMRTNKLTEPDAGVDNGVMEREFHEHLKKAGALSGRVLDEKWDYDRKFVLVDDAIGNEIDQALEWLRENRRFSPLADIINKQFSYLNRMRLLEAIKAHHSVPVIKEHLALGRKVVVFHDYNQGIPFSPFLFTFVNQKGEVVEGEGQGGYGYSHAANVPLFDADGKAVMGEDGKQKLVLLIDLYREFVKANPYVKRMDFGSMRNPIETLTAAFPDSLVYNGTISKGRREQAKAEFNRDGSSKDIIVVQSAAGQAGISLHDTTGKHQRVLINLGMPVRPTAAIQEEGRIYRIGQASNAAFRYFNTGTAWERHTFASVISERASTAENLALGNLARTLKQSFIDGFLDSDVYPASAEDGVGGKEADRGDNSLTPFERAKTFYWAQQKKGGRRDSREGVDYFATPEPIGFKMAEWANLAHGEKVMEPSAGHGAIARFLPERADRTLVEPSTDLATKAELAAPGARVVISRFEELHVGANKFHGVVMNPPFGMGGKTAMEHVAKAAKHLRNGGRLVALIPAGPSADKRFDAFRDANPDMHLIADILMPAVTFERAGTAVATHIAVFEKHTEDPGLAVGDIVDLTGAKTVNDLFDRIENVDLPPRTAPLVEDAPELTGIPEKEKQFTVAGITVRLDPLNVKPRFFLGSTLFRQLATLSEKYGGKFNRTEGFSFESRDQRDSFLRAWAAGEHLETETPAAAPTPNGAQVSVAFDLGETIHGKTGEPVFVATMGSRVERDVYQQINDTAKAHGGFYSSFRGGQAIPGFQFKTAEARQAFLRAMGAPGPLASAAPADPFFSALERAVEAMTTTRAPAAQWLSTLRRTPGVKQAELEWTGVTDWLDIQEGPVEKEALLRVIRDGGIQIDEVIYGGEPNAELRDHIESRVDAAVGQARFEAQEKWNGIWDGGSIYVAETTEENDDGEEVERWYLKAGSTAVFDETYDTEEEAQAEADKWNDDDEAEQFESFMRDEVDEERIREEIENEELEANEPKFHGWSSDPSNKTYRELLITLPVGERGNPSRAPSTHWDEEGVVAHTRFMDKTDADGKRVLFVEEIQSDWHQKGRDQGYSANAPDKQRLAEEATAADELYQQEAQRFGEFAIQWFEQQAERNADDARYSTIMRGHASNIREEVGGSGSIAMAMTARRQITNASLDAVPEIALRVAELQRVGLRSNEAFQAAQNAERGGIPDAPFKSSWPALVMKRVIRWAAEHGYDKVAWTTGEEQAERYNLSAATGPISIANQENGNYFVRFEPRAMTAIVDNGLARRRRQGSVSLSDWIIMSPEQITEAFGADVSKRLIEGIGIDGRNTLENDDLRVGGEGMKAFYDRNLVNITNDIIKKYGAKVGAVELPYAVPAGLNSLQSERNHIARQIGPGTPAPVADQHRQRLATIDAQIRKQVEFSDHPGFEITDKMREAAMGGFPLFRPGPGGKLRDAEELRTELMAQMKRLLPNDNIALKVAGGLTIDGKRVEGQYWMRVISVAQDAIQKPHWIFAHESVHAMKALGLFTPAEWNLLVEHAWTQNNALRANVQKRWRHLGMSEEQLQEEAVAEYFGEHWDMMEVEAKSSLLNRALRRILLFIAGVAKAVAKVRGINDAPINAFDLMQRMVTGKIGSRPEGFGEAPRDRAGRPVTVTFGKKTQPLGSVGDAFLRWFGDSKVVDANGAPLVVYHGTDAEFDAFERTEDIGFHLGTLAQAEDRAGLLTQGLSDGRMISAYIKVENPLRIKDLHDWTPVAVVSELTQLGIITERQAERALDREIIDREWVKGKLAAKGFDGIVYKNQTEGGEGTGDFEDSYIVFSPEQIKSTANAGTFDPNNPSILASAPVDISPASPEFDGDSEARWQDAKKGIGDGAGVVAKAKAWWEDLAAGFSRHWRDLPNEPRFADVQQQLRKLEAAPDAAMEESIRYLRGLVGTMDKAEYDLFARKAVLDDLSWDAGEGKELPFGFTPTTLKEARARVDAQVNLSPKLVAAVRDRKAHNKRIADAMVAAGVLTRDQIKNPAYFRHMVLEYARAEHILARSPSKVKSPYWAKRMGSTMDINANLLEAELDWMQKAQIDIATASTIEWIKASPLNVREELRTRAKESNRALLTEKLANDDAARKEDGRFRSMIARGFQIVKKELEAGHLDPVPAHLQAAADSIITDARDGDPPFALFAWILDGNRAGAMGAAMVLKATGQRKQFVRNLLGEKYVEPENIAGLVRAFKPEGMVAWQPKEGRHLFTAKTVSEHTLDMFVGKLADTASPGLDRAELQAALGSIRQQLVVGGERYTMIIPEELAATLDEFGDRRGEGMVAQFFGGIQSAWKRWVLINPRRFFKYNLNNMTGDLDAIIAGNPGTLRRVGEAWTMLRNASKGTVHPRYTEALERGVFTSGLSAQEIPDINAFSDFRHLAEGRSNRPDKLLVAGIAKVWRALQDTTNFREALFRLAAYLDYADKIEQGVPQLTVGYGASVPRMVDAVTDPKDRAALLARDLIGDYGAISVAGGWLRRYLIPFWSWKEINTKRYWRLTANAYRVSKARGIATGGALAAAVAARSAAVLYTRMALVYGALYLWNHMLFPDEEDDLGEMQKAQLHLILGRDSDGEVITLRTQGALSDVLATFGFTDAMKAFNKWQDGQGSPGGIATAMAKAPVNMVGTSVTPLISNPVELALGQELWPDMFNPRPIHDRWRHTFQTVSLENEYDAVADRPSRGYARSWTEAAVYRRDPAEMAYDEAKGIAYDWLSRVKGQDGGSFSSPRSEALRDYRRALRYDDQDAADKALLRYEELGGTDKGLKTSIARQHPLGPIAKKDRAEFLDSLTDEQLDTFAEAEVYWRELYAPEE